MPYAECIQGNPGSGNHPKKWPRTGIIHQTERISLEITYLTEYLLRDQQTKREGGEGALQSTNIR